MDQIQTNSGAAVGEAPPAEATEAAPPPTPVAPPKLRKVPLVEMVNWVEQEEERLARWVAIAKSDDARAYMRDRWNVARRTKQALELLLKHETQFMEMIRPRR